jgi:ribose transport system substrate-binding protein
MHTSRLTMRRWLPAALSVFGAAGAMGAHADDGTFMKMAAKKVESAVAHQTTWTGPTTGPSAVTGKSIVFVASDMKNGGVLGVSRGVEEAARTIGWTLRLMDGQGTVSGRTAALNQALALKPSGIILGGFDATEQAAALRGAAERKVPVVGWHAAKAGGAADGLFFNVTTSARDVAEIAALYAIVQSGGNAGVVIFTDSAYAVAIAKSDAMAQTVKECAGCKLLEVQDTPLVETSTRMPQLTTSLIQRYGRKWRYALGINDLYFDFMGPALAAAGGAGTTLVNLSAGDGSESAYQRVRSGQFQAGTVPEPLNLHGWQAVDELNRAFAGQPPSGFSTPVHLVTKANIAFDGGPRNAFDPDNGYRDVYRKIWGKSH